MMDKNVIEPKENKSELKKREIVKSIFRLVAKDGMENISMAKIAKGIDIPSSLIFHYFKNKQELIYSLVDYTLELCQSQGRVELQSKLGLSCRFDEYIDDQFREAVETSKDEIIVYFACRNMANRDEIVFKKFKDHEELIIQQSMMDIEHYIAQGEIEHANPRMAACYLTSIINGIAYMSDFIAETEMFQKAVAEHKIKILEYFKYKNK